MRSRKRILVVEDDGAIARGIKELLRAEGYLVQVASNGESALQHVTKFSPDLLLLDINLPGINGIEVCRQARSTSFAKPIIMLTSRSEQLDKVLGLEVGADDYITKPFDSREVIARVRAHLRLLERLPASKEEPPAGNMRHPRKLLAVMFTDMKDFSKKMNKDEKLAIALLKRHNTLLRRCVKQHGGRVIEVIGDAFLVSFESALKAVQCGTAIQNKLKIYNASKPKQEQVKVRIGLHLGDVLEMEGKLRGDTINIAARLQQIATPGQITISESVYDAIRGKVKVHTLRVGRRKVKNIRQPVTVYRVSV